MERKQFLKIAAGTVTMAVVPGLGLIASACGSDSNKEDEQAATAAPPASGAAGSPAAATPAQVKATKLFVDVDTVRGSKNLTNEEKPTQSCVQNSAFAKNEQIVFRARVYDPLTGAALDDKAMKDVIVQFKNGTKLDPMGYGPHPKDPPNESFWTVGYVIPPDFPTGTLDFTVTATDKEGRVGVFNPIRIPATALLTVTSTVRAIIPATPTPAATPKAASPAAAPKQ